jgi:hypothetical protein
MNMDRNCRALLSWHEFASLRRLRSDSRHRTSSGHRQLLIMPKTRLCGELLVRFRMDVANVFEESGKETLIQVLRTDPEVFWELVHKTLRRKEAARLGPSPLDADLDWLVERAVAGLRRGTPHEGKPARGRMH